MPHLFFDRTILKDQAILCWLAGIGKGVGGKYFRIAADVIVDGENLADVLVEAGMAVRYDGGKKTHKWCGG